MVCVGHKFIQLYCRVTETGKYFFPCIKTNFYCIGDLPYYLLITDGRILPASASDIQSVVYAFALFRLRLLLILLHRVCGFFVCLVFNPHSLWFCPIFFYVEHLQGLEYDPKWVLLKPLQVLWICIIKQFTAAVF